MSAPLCPSNETRTDVLERRERVFVSFARCGRYRVGSSRGKCTSPFFLWIDVPGR